jgi:hypothetical protein
MPGACERTRVVKKLSPSQFGALKLARRFGDALVCVRYRQDEQGTRRYTTVELLVEEAPILKRRNDSDPVGVRIGLQESALRRQAIAHGATWDSKSKLWRMPRKTARLLKLTERVLEK